MENRVGCRQIVVNFSGGWVRECGGPVAGGHWRAVALAAQERERQRGGSWTEADGQLQIAAKARK